MGKRKEIKFRRDGRVHEGRQNGVIFRLYEGREICTEGHQYFHLDAAKEFCQQIAAGEIDMEAVQKKFAAEDAASGKREVNGHA